MLLVAAFIMAEDISGKVKTAVDGLAESLNGRLEVSVGDIFLDGTETSSGLSRSLSNWIISHAPDTGRFVVTPRTRGIPKANASQKGVIQGKFWQEGNTVHVNLQLVSEPGNNILVSRNFTLSAKELKDAGIDVLPANLKNQDEAKKAEEKFSPPAAPVPPKNNPPPAPASSLKIAAWPDSDSDTYVDGDEFKINLEANQNCYVKVYHFDKDGTMQLIYPNRDNPDNSLRANTVKTIPELPTRYVITAPFGQDTVMVIASNQKFENLEAEFDVIKKATQETINSSRGLGIKRIPNAPAAETVTMTFNFTSLSSDYSDASYSYRKPVNMNDTIQTLRTEVQRQNGSFSGNDRSGTFSVSGTAGNYRVSGDTVIVNLRYTGNQSISRSRGVGFSFSMDKPRNMNQAVQSVRTGIEGKGGIFNGNERQGSFKASGIEGQYNVSDRVTVSISEKPVLIPNSLIEKEVKSYFSGK
jgi:hypothetical protein